MHPRDMFLAEKVALALDSVDHEFALEWYRRGVMAERKRWMEAVTDEPELPGEMPDEMWNVLRSDRDAAGEALRIIVRQTKGGILTRGMRSNVELTGSRAGSSPVSPATEGSEVERRVGGME